MPRVVVSGAPGTGKSTIAAALAQELGRPLLALDDIKEALADILGLGDEEWSNRVGDAAAEVIFRLAGSMLTAVVEGWWRGPRRDRALVEFSGAVEVFCHCSPLVATDRMRARIGLDRHPIHRDVINPTVLLDRAAELAASVTAIGLGGPLITVDTERAGSVAAAVAATRAALTQ